MNTFGVALAEVVPSGLYHPCVSLGTTLWLSLGISPGFSVFWGFVPIVCRFCFSLCGLKSFLSWI